MITERHQCGCTLLPNDPLCRVTDKLPSSIGPRRNLMLLRHTINSVTYRFDGLKELLAKATAARSGDELAGVAAKRAVERGAARIVLADLPLRAFVEEPLVPYAEDEVTRLIFDRHDAPAFALVSHLTVGGFRDWLLSDHATGATLRVLAPGLMPEMVAAVSKLMRVQDLVA